MVKQESILLAIIVPLTISFVVLFAPTKSYQEITTRMMISQAALFRLDADECRAPAAADFFIHPQISFATLQGFHAFACLIYRPDAAV